MDDLRKKFIADNIVKARKKKLTDWERKFVNDMEGLTKLSSKEFNTLHEIANKPGRDIKKRELDLKMFKQRRMIR